MPEHAARYQRGVVIVMIVVMLPVLVGLTALVIEGARARVARSALQHAADAAALAAAAVLPDVGAAQTEAITYAEANAPSHGTIVNPSDVETGNWESLRQPPFIADGSPLNAVQVKAYRNTDHGNPMDAIFAQVFGISSFEIEATAVAIQQGGGTGTSSRFLIDDEMISDNVDAIKDLGEGDTPISDGDDDGYIDLHLYLPAGTQIDVPTGQVGDEGLFDIDHPAFPFSDTSDPSFADFLNYNENGGWRQDLLDDDDLDPLTGVSPVDDGVDYDQFLSQECQVSPVYKSDVSDLGDEEVNAKGERRGLVAFKIVAILDDPPGDDLPNIRIEICDPIDDIGSITHGSGGGGGGASALVH